jgi:hypothetical protein
MACKGHLVLDMFNTIKHDPSCLEVTTRLHLLHQVKSIPLPIHKHFEKEHFFPKLQSWKTTILDVIITTIGLESHNDKDVPFIT